MEAESGWPVATLRCLQSTLPLDSNKAILFLPERSETKHSRLTEEEKKSTVTDLEDGGETFTGDEAKLFYERILSLPKEKKTYSQIPRTPRERKARKQNSKRSSKMDYDVLTPSKLFYYVQNNELELLRSSLSRTSFDINMQDEFHWTMLMVAAYSGHVTIVKYLLANGANWRDFKDKKGRNSADLAKMGGHPEIAEFIMNYDSNDRQEANSSVIIDEQLDNKQLKNGRGGFSSESLHTVVLKQKETSKESVAGEDCAKEIFYCELCQMPIPNASKSDHSTSTLHLFSCQHQPSVTSYGIPESNRGFQMLLRSGWDREKGLGPHKQGQRFPVKTVLKQDRLGFGSGGGEGKQKARVTHFSAHDRAAVRFSRDRHKKVQQVPKKKDILQEKQKDKQWEKRLRRMMNEDDVY